jgi:hypothetical protein
MGPPFFNGGNARVDQAVEHVGFASMGPPFFNGGNTPPCQAMTNVSLVQISSF